MKLILHFFFFFLFFCSFSNENKLIAGLGGLGRETWGAGGIEHDIEVNPIEDIEEQAIESESENIKKKKGIKSIELKNIDPNTIGVLSNKEGLGYEMWKGSERKFVEKYLTLLPINKESNVAIDLTKKLLLTSANTPSGEGENNLFTIRIKKLLELGDLENTKLLIDSLSDYEKNEEIQKIEVEINLSFNNFDLVCSSIDEKIKKYKSDIYWKKIQIFCQILNDETHKANLGLSLIKEHENFNDDIFLNIVDSLIYKEEIDISQYTDIDLLNLTMTRIGKIILPDDLSFPNDPLFLSMLYRMPNVPIETRIRALEQSQKLISIPEDIIQEMYNSYEIKENETKFSLDSDFPDLGPATQAILYQRAIKEDSNENKAKIIKQAFNLAQENKNYSLIVKLNLETLLEIKASKKLLWFANTASKALFYSNELEMAFDWYKLLINNRNDNINIFIDLMEIWPIAEIFKLYEKDYQNKKELNISQEEIIESISKFQLQDETLSFNTIGLYFLETFGIKINPSIWLATLEENQDNSLIMPNSSIISLIDFATKNNRVGEAVLLILIAADGNELIKFNPFFLQKIITSLDRLGLGEKVKDLIIETLIS